MRKPFFKKSHRCWYVWNNGKPIRLDPDEEKAFRLWEDIREASNPSGVSAPLKAVAEAYLRHLAARIEGKGKPLKKATMDQYAKDIAKFCNMHGSKRSRSVKRHHLTDFLNSQTEWSVHQTRHGISAIKAMMQWATDEELIHRNPFARYPRPKTPRREHLGACK